MRVALTSLCLGDAFRTMWTTRFRAGWEAYTKRHGYDLRVFDEPLDRSDAAAARSPAWQKCLVLEALADYDRVIWVDADIAIHPRAPAIVDGVPAEKVGAVVSGDLLHDDMKAVFLERVRRGVKVTPGGGAAAWADDQRVFYRRVGLEPTSSDIVQTGVLVLSPAHHRDMLQRVYRAKLKKIVRSHEQLPLSAEILDGGRLHRLDSRFNLVFAERAIVHYPYLFEKKQHPQYAELARLAVATEFRNSFFLHFAYDLSFSTYLSA